MPRTAIVFGVLLIGLGFGSYALAMQTSEADEAPSKTALIPAVVGAVLALLGFWGIAQPGMRKHAMHAAAAVGVLGFLAAAGRWAMVAAKGAELTALGPVSLLVMAGLCGGFVLLCVKSFRDARRNRANEAVPEA